MMNLTVPPTQSSASRPMTVFTILVLWLTLMVPNVAESQPRPYRLDGLNGEGLGPEDLARGVVIAVVWASWSPHCRNIDVRVDAIAERWGSQARVIMVNFQEDRAEVEAFLAGRKPKAPVYLDESGAFSKQHSVTSLPGLVIFKDGSTAFSGKLSRDPHAIISRALS